MTAHRLRNIARQSLATAVAGILATIPMSAVMLVAGATGRMGTQPPRRVVDEAVDGVPGTEASAAARDAAATFLHFALGGAMAVGVVPFRAVIRRVVPRPVDELLAGGVFGGLLYALNYAGLAPALGVLPPPTEDRPSRQRTMLVAHLVYGVTVALLVRVLASSTARTSVPS